MVARKITRGQVRTVTMKLLKEQGGLCPVCAKPIDLAQRSTSGDGPALDHDHRTGHIRGVLHRSCNGGIGKAESIVGRWITGSMQDEQAIIQDMQRMVNYLLQPNTDLIYYTHKTPEELRQAQLLRQRKQRAQRKARATVRTLRAQKEQA